VERHIAEVAEQPLHLRDGLARPGLGLAVAGHRGSETTFDWSASEVVVADDLMFDCRGFFARKSFVVSASALAYSVSRFRAGGRDSADDPESSGIGADDDPEWHARNASLNAAMAIASNRASRRLSQITGIRCLLTSRISLLRVV
jgi:hypothetical protein